MVVKLAEIVNSFVLKPKTSFKMKRVKRIIGIDERKKAHDQWKWKREYRKKRNEHKQLKLNW